MGKKIRETILLLVLFVFAILILELTGIREKENENQVQIPKSCNILIRIDIQDLSKKIVLSELYSNRAPELIRNLLEMNNQDQDDTDNIYNQFVHQLDDFSSPLEILSVNINGQNLLFLRGKSSFKSKTPLLFSSKNDFLYLQLNGPNLPREDILKAINDIKTFDVKKTTLSDIEIYEHAYNNLYLKAHLNTSSDKINLHVIQGENESNSMIGLEPNGLHFQAPASFFEYVIDANKIDQISLNYFGFNFDDHSNWYPNTDILFTYRDSIDKECLEESAKLIFKTSQVKILKDEEKEKLMIDDMAYSINDIPPNKIFLSTNDRKPRLATDSSNALVLSGNASQIFQINTNSWQGFLANEILSGIGFINEIKSMFSQFKPIRTVQVNNESIITFQLNKKHSIYAYIFSILSKA
tara:strand:+ start:479 stop:1711 length:1233 start_codon:yes stop_codon:yes gene_type:complete